MTSEKELYWMALGVVQIGGKEYGADDALPVGDISKAQLERWKRTGKIGEKITAVVNDHRDAKIAELEATVSGLNDSIAEADERKKAHAENRGSKISELAEANISLTTKFTELSGRITALPSDTKKLKAAVTALKAELAEVE